MFWDAVGISLAVTFVTVMVTTIYLHRSATHRSLQLVKPLSIASRAWLWLTTGIVTRQWVAVHRKHHQHTDEEGDPHSPHLEGFWQIQIGNIKYYRDALKEEGLVDRYAPDVVKQEGWYDRWIFNHSLWGPALGLSLLCLSLGLTWGWAGVWLGLYAVAQHGIVYVFLLSSTVNALCHWKHPSGYQHTDDSKAATTYNNILVALFTGGEGYHHNHHWSQISAKFSHKPWEIDLGWYVVRILEKLGLAYDVKNPDRVRA